MNTTPLNSLPVIITEPGDYMTASGKRVTVREIREADKGVTAFTAKGSVWREFRGKVVPRGYAIWHPSGRYNALHPVGMDIVGKWPKG